MCPWRGGQEVGRVELRIPGVTIAWDTGGQQVFLLVLIAVEVCGSWVTS